MSTKSCVVLALLASAAAVAAAEEPTDMQAVVGAGSHWRYYVMLSAPMISAAKAKAAGMSVAPADRLITRPAPPCAPIIGVGTGAPPPEGWRLPGFDDQSWAGHRGPLQADPFGTAWPAELSPEFALVCGRFKFVVHDPAAVRKLLLRAKFRGGMVAWLNGREVARAALPAGELRPDTPGDDYDDDVTLLTKTKLLHWYDNRDLADRFRQRDRLLEGTAIDPVALRKGVNVLAVEIHRSDYPVECQKLGLRWGANGLTELHLEAQAAPGAIAQAVARPAGVQVWNVDAAGRLVDLDFADPAEPIRAMRIVGARNGTFSGTVAVGSTAVIRGLRAQAGVLTSAGGTIPASAVTVRYGALDDRSVGDKAHGLPAYAFDALLTKPAEVPLGGTGKPNPRPPVQADARAARGLPVNPVPGAVVPVWVTVKVPKDAAPGEYRGELVVSAVDVSAVKVPIRLTVTGWTLPDVADYACILNVYQSPDTLAMHYKVPLWSDAHWALIERSLKLMGEMGNDFLYIPLLSKDQFGNAESMVYWVPKDGAAAPASRPAAGEYRFDFTVMDRYLDLFLKHHDGRRVKMIVLVAWGTATRKDAVTVTALDPATGAKSDLLLPPYGTKACEDLWRQALPAIRDRLKARGLDDRIMLGMPCDIGPTPEHVAMFARILPGVPWMRACHPDNSSLRADAADPAKTVPVACVEHVWWGPIPDPAKKRQFGWQLPRMRVSFNRAGYGPLCLLGFCAPWDFRIWLETSLAADDRGAGRVGADFYSEGIKLEKLGRGDFERNTGSRGTLFNRYPDSNVYQIGLANNTTDLLPPGPDGPVASIRYENAREGIQAAETVIFIEKALLAGRLPPELTARGWELIDERINCLRYHPIGLGRAGWQDRSAQLFALAAEIARSAGQAAPV